MFIQLERIIYRDEDFIIKGNKGDLVDINKITRICIDEFWYSEIPTYLIYLMDNSRLHTTKKSVNEILRLANHSILIKE